MHVKDCAECFKILERDPEISTETWNRLPAIWSKLLNTGALNAIVVVDTERAMGSQIVQFGASVFVTDKFMSAAKSKGTPSLTGIVFDAYLKGSSPILDRPQIAKANASANLKLIVIHAALNFDGMTEGEIRALVAFGPESFLYAHAGYQLREILIQPPSEMFRTFALNSGYKERHYQSEPRHVGSLIGITRNEADKEPGLYVSRAFAFQPPRLGFNDREQEQLSAALNDLTDDEIADELTIAAATVKSRWRNIYLKVADFAPELLPNSLCDQTSAPQRRSSEKRRHLLSYLRQHPEELRPYCSGNIS
jgi:DNA-binding CsgD family transcriptional regulator